MKEPTNTTTLTITTEKKAQAREILRLLEHAEAFGDLDFPFNCRIDEDGEPETIDEDGVGCKPKDRDR